MIARILPFALVALALPAMAQDTYTLDATGNVAYGVVETDTFVEDFAPDHVEDHVVDYGVPLAPGEEIIGFYAAPSAVWVPVEAEVLHDTPAFALPVEIDRVTGLPRNTVGWTGEADAPLGIGCFPQGVCTELND